MNRITKIIVGAFIGLFLIASTIIVVISVKVKDAGAYKASQKYIETNPDVLKETGEIKGYSFFTSGSIEHNSKGGVAYFSYTVEGSKSDLPIHIVLKTDSLDNWNVIDFTMLE
ncbi:hypothetical protein [Pontibacter fetidus]|uniref:Uncharacterized protein n=1 Tax=Pontibacter fetidus TaxID=2700082 RepID=A0A6B2GXV0_9BACT|nr:hypothetical protein [Pontibacter fetidus]NDK54811.1 hypothetical protein [Pontibacter fetidus]